jgi:hypothetical protein
VLRITIPPIEVWDGKNERFINFKGQTLQLEHSLVSLSKWESKWHKPFISKTDKTYEETVDYIRCMTLTQHVDPNAYTFLTEENINQVNAYIDDPMTATTFSEDKTKKNNGKVVTAEVIYHWMIAFHIPFECQKWHLNRLLTLIRVCNIENQPPKKLSMRERLSRNAEINAANRKKFNSKG